MPHALIVDDEKHSLSGLAEWVEQEGFEAHAAATVAEARKVIEGQRLDLALVDLQLPDGNGLDVVTSLQEQPDVEIVMITGHGTIDSAVEALRLGASDYLTKPIDIPRLERILETVRKTLALRHEVDELRGELRRLGRFGSLVGSSPAMQEVYDLIERVAPTGSTVFLTGPTGVGKELAARMVHALSRRSERSFVPENCGAIASNLIESELFGHERGSFTGAERRRIGVFERADGGTLFLDEITEMPIELQVKLLRVLETGSFQRVGGEESRQVDVRVIAATNRDPEEALQEGRIREDLLYRLNVFPIRVPPLRERGGDDVELLALHFLGELNREGDTNKRFTDAAMDKLRLHSWPGNVRELKNVVQRAFILAGDRLEAAHVPLQGPAPRRSAESETLEIPVGTSLAEAERELILATLERADGHRRNAARMLRISPKTLYNRLKKYDL